MSILLPNPTRKTTGPLCSSCLGLASLIFCPLSTSPQIHHSPTTNNVISHFLLNECHLSSSQISKIFKAKNDLLRARSSRTAREAVELMRDCGFTQSQLQNTILRNPAVLTRKVDRYLKPVFDFLRALGFVGQNLPILVSKQPRVVGCSLEKNLIPRIPFLQKLLGPNRSLLKSLERSPDLLIQSVEKRLKPRVEFFKQRGIEGESLSLLLSMYPKVFTRASTELLQMREEYVENTMGITKGSKAFLYALCVTVQNAPENVEKKMKHLQSLGLLEDEVHELVKKNPSLLHLSTKKMQENMEFLTCTAGLQPNVVLPYPRLLCLSVEKRLMPRHAVVRTLHAMQKSMPRLPNIFSLSEQKFLQKFVECNPHASMLKEIYKGKVNPTGVETT